MTDEAALSLKLSVMLVLTASVLSVIISLVGMGGNILNNFANGYENQTTSAGYSTVLKLASQPDIEGPMVYKCIINTLGSYSTIKITDINGITSIWESKVDGDNLAKLDVLYKNIKSKYYKLEVKKDSNGYSTIDIKEVLR